MLFRSTRRRSQGWVLGGARGLAGGHRRGSSGAPALPAASDIKTPQLRVSQDPVPAVAKNDDEAWGAAAATVPLLDDDDNFDSPSPLKKTNAVVIVTEIVPTPAASGDDEDWVLAMRVAPAAIADVDNFRGGGGDGGAFAAPDSAAAQDDAFGGGAAIADTFNAAAPTPRKNLRVNHLTVVDRSITDKGIAVIKKRVLDKTLHPPEKSKTFADFFVPQHSEQYEDPVPGKKKRRLSSRRERGS